MAVERGDMQEGTIRVAALCVIRNGDRILVALGYAPQKGEFYRPLGGGIHFGERSRDAVIREVMEEIRAELTNLRCIGFLENCYSRAGRPQHELLIMYEGEMVDKKLTELAVISGMEEGELFDAEWVSLSEFVSGGATLFPDGLLELITSKG